MKFELPVLAPSLLAADFTRLGEEIESCIREEISWLHCDIMDGHFVPNISFGPDIVAAARRAAPETFLDVHLMMEDPDSLIEDFVEAGADMITVHQETCIHLHRTLQRIQDYGCMTGVALNPATPVELIEPVLNSIDMVLIMSVNPGFGGQPFITDSYDKIDRLVQMRGERHFLIGTDGGVNLQNIRQLVRKGADVLVAGNSIFKAENISEQISRLRGEANLGRKDYV